VIWSTYVAAFIYGASVYYYIRALIDEKINFNWIFFLNYSPSFLIFILFVRNLLLHDKERISLANNIFAYHNVWYNIIFVIVSNIGVLMFMLAGLFYFREYLKTQSIRKNDKNKWITIYLLSIIIFCIASIPAGIVYKGKYFVQIVPFFSFTVYYAIILQRLLLYKTFDTNYLWNRTNDPMIDNSDIVKKIDDIVANQKMYLNKNLTLQLLADKLQITNKKLSQILNAHQDLSFTDYLNKYRVEESKKKLLNPDLQGIKIDTIAQDSGFNSRTTFYEAFKKHEGCTPSQFRKRNI
jgi:AraC-like DNA-binding protein